MLVVAVVLGIVEGLTEFLPVSSTGHLILAARWMGFEGRRAETFEIVIQLGAILAVVWEYRAKLNEVLIGLADRPESKRLATNLFVAFVPSALLGVTLHDTITSRLFHPEPVAWGLIGGAVLILLFEARPYVARSEAVADVSRKQAFLVGLMQCLALWPGLSRSAATILGGLGTGMTRRVATEFSFFLAIPTMFAATSYDLVVRRADLEAGDLAWLALSFAVSFAVALVAIRWLLRYVSTHTFRPFAWYRLALGAAVLAASRWGLI
jgi:undecaprenyl-diphosphatase